MFTKPPFVPIVAGVGLVLFTIFAILAPLDTWWPLLAGPAEYQQTVAEASFLPLQAYVDDGCPWRSVVAWRHLREDRNGPARFRAAFIEARTPAARLLALAGLLGRDSMGWTAGLRSLREEPALQSELYALNLDHDIPEALTVDSGIVLVESGTLTRRLEAVDLRREYCSAR
jgi:hypothetical protein